MNRLAQFGLACAVACLVLTNGCASLASSSTAKAKEDPFKGRYYVRSGKIFKEKDQTRVDAIEAPYLIAPETTLGQVIRALGRVSEVGANGVVYDLYGFNETGSALDTGRVAALRTFLSRLNYQSMRGICRVLGPDAPTSPEGRLTAVRTAAQTLAKDWSTMYLIEGPDSAALAAEFSALAPYLVVIAPEGGHVTLLDEVPADVGKRALMVKGYLPPKKLEKGEPVINGMLPAEEASYEAYEQARALEQESQPWTPDNSVLSAEEQAEGWIALFNEKDLSGWELVGDDKEGFGVVDKEIRWVREGGGYMQSRDRYDNFILRLEYKINKGGNSGVFLRAPRANRCSKIGMEFQIMGDHGIEAPHKNSSSAVYDVWPALKDATKPEGEWNSAEIMLHGPYLRATLNGEVVQDINFNTNPELANRLRRGFIGLQDHGHPAAFRKIRINKIENPDGFMLGAVASESGFEGAVEVAEVVREDSHGYATVTVPYRDMHGKTKVGQARVYLSEALVNSGATIPTFCHAHYELGEDGAKKWVDKGWAVVSPHYSAEYPIDVSIGDSYNLAKAIIQWARRQPLLDGSRVHIDGGSQGGYMTLAMAAENFPVAAATANVPVVNWAYTLNYFEANKPASGYPDLEPDKSPLPVLRMVTVLADYEFGAVPSSYSLFGDDLTSDNYYYVSPISYVDQITCPTMVICATGDMLVPHAQITNAVPQPVDPKLFDKYYMRDFDLLTLPEKARTTLTDLIAPEKLYLHVVGIPEGGLHEFTRDDSLGKGGDKKQSEAFDYPWAADKQWNVVVLNEGPPLPYSPHSRYEWRAKTDSFVDHFMPGKIPVDALTAPKLARLLARYRGDRNNQVELVDGTKLNRMNFAAAERLDVVSGLLAYARTSPEHAERLRSLSATVSTAELAEQLTLENLQTLSDTYRSAIQQK